MKRVLSIMVSGAVIAVFGGMVAAEEPMPGSEIMKKAQTQQEKVSEQGEKATGKTTDTIKKADKAKETVKKRGKNVKEIKAGKDKPAEKVKKTADEGEKGVQELKDIKKDIK